MGFLWFGKKETKLEERPKTNEIIFKYEYEHASWNSYSSETRIKRGYIDFFKERFRQREFNNIMVISEYNEFMYPFFDIDDLTKYNHFVRNATCNYVSFQSSPGHFWIFVDKPFRKYTEFKNDDISNDWAVYSDTKYQSMSNNRKEFHVRGFFEKLEKQPGIVDKKGNFSENFSEFISKLENYYNVDCLELSALRYNDPDMLLKLRRIQKLNRITN
jgi:hypothetical protein